LAASLEVPFGTGLRFIQDLLDVPFAHFELIVFYDIKWALDTARIRTQANFTSTEISEDRNFSLDA
jgi:hypothetical protein